MPLLSEKLAEADAILRASSVSDSRREASLLLALALKRDKTFLIAHPEYVLEPTEEDIVDGFVGRRASREPLQYISGVQEFYGLDFEVTPDVLIPRPETEMVVERALEIFNTTTDPFFCEVGVGSGCIAVSILHQLTRATAIGLDVSSNALAVARRNAEKHDVIKRLKLVESDVYGALREEKFDMIVSNPPYVPANEFDGLQTEVRNFEPPLALIGGSDGLSIVRRIVTEAPRFLHSGGSLLMEIGFDQSERVASLFDPSIWHPPDLLPDLQGIPRLIGARLI